MQRCHSQRAVKGSLLFSEHYRSPGGNGHRRISGGIFHKITAGINAESKDAAVEIIAIARGP